MPCFSRIGIIQAGQFWFRTRSILRLGALLASKVTTGSVNRGYAPVMSCQIPQFMHHTPIVAGEKAIAGDISARQEVQAEEFDIVPPAGTARAHSRTRDRSHPPAVPATQSRYNQPRCIMCSGARPAIFVSVSGIFLRVAVSTFVRVTITRENILQARRHHALTLGWTNRGPLLFRPNPNPSIWKIGEAIRSCLKPRYLHAMEYPPVRWQSSQYGARSTARGASESFRMEVGRNISMPTPLQSWPMNCVPAANDCSPPGSRSASNRRADWLNPNRRPKRVRARRSVFGHPPGAVAQGVKLAVPRSVEAAPATARGYGRNAYNS